MPERLADAGKFAHINAMYDDDPFDPDNPLEDYPTLQAVRRFTDRLSGVAWFSQSGQPLEVQVLEVARNYVEMLGFPEVAVAAVEDWSAATLCAEIPDWNSAPWETEEQLRAALRADALEFLDEDLVVFTVSHITGLAEQYCTPWLERAVAGDPAGVDEALMRAAIGAAVQATHDAGLVLLAGGEETHPFMYKYLLFEAGRWPINIAGASFSLF